MRTITAYYDSRADAERARSRLDDAGVSTENTRILDQGEDLTSTTTAVNRAENSGGFFAALRDLFLPEDDRDTYAEGLRRGGFLLAVRVDEAQSDRVVDLLEDTGAIDLDTRQDEWRSMGWHAPESRTNADAMIMSSAGPRTRDVTDDTTAETREKSHLDICRHGRTERYGGCLRREGSGCGIHPCY